MSSGLGWKAAAGIAAMAASAHAANWVGGSGNWANVSPASPGWNTVSFPNGIGGVSQKIDGTTATLTQDVAGGITLGTHSLGGSSNVTFSITPTTTITLNEDGAGSGVATISNTNTSTQTTRVQIGNAAGGVKLADDVLFSNTSGSTSTFSINVTAPITGTGNMTFYNVSNSTSVAPIGLGATNSFTGSVLVKKGAVALANPGFGGAGNAVTLGSAGEGSATLVTTGTSTTIANPITVAANTGGTLVLGSTQSDPTNNNSTYSGPITLNGDVTLTSAKPSNVETRYTGIISGAGAVTVAGTGKTRLSAANTYTGSTTLTGGSTLLLSDDASLKFVIGASGVNNKITGSGQTLTLDGDFNFDLTGSAANGSWTIVDVANLNETFGGTFQVLGGFTQSSDVWTRVVGLKTYTFTEATGILTAVTVPEPAGLGLAALLALPALSRRRMHRLV